VKKKNKSFLKKRKEAKKQKEQFKTNATLLPPLSEKHAGVVDRCSHHHHPSGQNPR